MNAEILIKARKVFVEEPVEYSETCPYCASKGIDNKLRYYYISLEEAIYKCAGSSCLYPFQRFIFKSLVDNSVYYYEEVLEGGREAIFRVPLDDQPIYQSKNPLSTKLFCDSQRNPDIESYSCDFSDLLDDLESEPEPKSQPESKSADVNLDFLEFLDNTTPADLNTTDQVLNENGVDDLIDNLLKELPNTTPIKPVKTVSDKKSKAVASKAKTEVKLSKAIEHIEKAKSSKSQKSREKPAETFSTAIRKARKSQSKAKAEESPIKTESETEPEQVQPKPQQILATKKLTTALKSASVLRPTALAMQLSSMDLTKINSDFLRQYMKSKEDKLFENEPSILEVGNENGVPKKNVEHKFERLIPKQKCETVTSASIAEKKTTKPKATSSKDVIKKESPSEIEVEKSGTVVKKERKPRVSKPKSTKADAKATKVKEEQPKECSKLANSVSTEQESVGKTKVKEEKPPRKRSTGSKKEQKMAEDETKNVNKKGAVESYVEKNTQKKTASTITSDSSITDANTKSKKRSYSKRPKADELSVKIESNEPKSKRRRTTKSTEKSNKVNLPSLPPIIVSDTESESKSQNEQNLNPNSDSMVLSNLNPTSNDNSTSASVGSPSINQKCLKSVQQMISDDSESSHAEPLLGFTPADRVERVKRHMVFEEIETSTTSSTQKLTKSRSNDKKPKDVKSVKVEPQDDSSESSSSKRSRGRPTSSKSKAEAKPKRASKSRKDDALKSKTEVVAELTNVAQITLSDPSETKENVQQDFAFGSLIEADNAIACEPIPDVLNDTTVSTEMVKQTKEICLQKSSLNKNQAKESTGKSQQPYQIKKLKREEAKSFKLDDILGDWDENESEQTNDQQRTIEGDCNAQTGEILEVDDTDSIITITSETSDNNFSFAGEPGSSNDDFL